MLRYYLFFKKVPIQNVNTREAALPSCWRREVAFVLIRPVHRSIDGGRLSGLACRSPGSARSIRKEAANVRCGRLLGKPAPESGTLWHRDGARGGHEGGRPLLEGANVYYPPPGVNGRMRRTGLAVHAVTSCARAAPAMSSTAALENLPALQAR